MLGCGSQVTQFIRHSADVGGICNKSYNFAIPPSGERLTKITVNQAGVDERSETVGFVMHQTATGRGRPL